MAFTAAALAMLVAISGVGTAYATPVLAVESTEDTSDTGLEDQVERPVVPLSETDGEQPTDAGDEATEDPETDGGDDATEAPEPAPTPSPRQSREVGTLAALTCTPGSFYSVSATGQLRSVTNGTIADVGTAASGVTSFNGLGVSTGGTRAMAYERTNSNRTATIYDFNTTTNTWASTGRSLNTNLAANGGFTGSLVAGAISQATGDFLFGGFQTVTTGNTTQLQFRIWRYSPGNQSFGYLGYINGGNVAAGTTANGDLDLDANGNMFIVRGSGTSAIIYSVTAANLASANGGLIPSSASNSFTASTNVNGAAFDASGRLYLGSQTTVDSFAMPGFTDRRTVTTGLTGSTDLASCSSPPTIAVEKVVNGRAKAEDQFTLSLSSGGVAVASATTEGSSTGVQAQRIGPLPTGRGLSLTFTETAAGQARLSDYTTSWECRVDGATTPFANGTGTTGTITVPNSGQAIRCAFTNATRPATTRVDKVWVIDGQRFAHGLQPQGFNATLRLSPAGTPSGETQWGQVRSGFAIGQQVTVSEDVTIDSARMPGCRVSSARLTGSGITGSVDASSGALVTLPGAANTYTLTNTVTCEQTLTLTKQLDHRHGGTRVPADWNGRLFADSSGAGRLTFASGQTQTVPTGSFVISENQLAGYELGSVSCQGATFNASTRTVTLARGQQAQCTIVNRDLPGTLSWTVTDPAGTPIGGSTWTLIRPGGADPLLIEDCVAASAASCTGLDRNPAAGGFSLDNLRWGDYVLVEESAPAGFQPSTTRYPFTISGEERSITTTAFVNQQVVPPTLPRTGGTGSDGFTIAGAILLGGGLAAAIPLWLRRRAVRP
ncbi:SpaA isopeptide-forming pilin-related protein [Citricoccus sp. NR2]|uniref:SpaA isopeptide-forming pilin-related protein n=1 Tax=Citricoccus sp. NR2 TaxID=3004095 RepID=UPI0022DD1E14|nr:SpaA isopeptide-forming pilin-related protein [Citricoccus sp. NR2]WBL19990.1 SpaA isopeptide-forming pilin-related protein [Citricoccus sp. NR2]